MNRLKAMMNSIPQLLLLMIIVAVVGYLIWSYQFNCEHGNCPSCCTETYPVEYIAVVLDLIILLRIIYLSVKKLLKK